MTKIDSHDFIPQVTEAGVKVLVTEHPVETPEDVTVVETENGREALALLSAARFGYPSRKLTMIGVTGTKGKTTTTHMIKTILETAGKKTGMIGTNGVYIGEEHFPTVNTTPESYDLHRYFAKMVEAGCECCVMEVSSQAMKMHRWQVFTSTMGSSPTFLRITSEKMSTRTLRSIYITRNSCSTSVTVP